MKWWAVSSLYTLSTPSANHVRNHLEKGGTTGIQELHLSYWGHALVLTTEYSRTIFQTLQCTPLSILTPIPIITSPASFNRHCCYIKLTSTAWNGRTACSGMRRTPRKRHRVRSLLFCANHVSDFPLRCQQGPFLAGLISLLLCNPRLCPSNILLFPRSFLFLLLFFFPGSAFLWFLGTEADGSCWISAHVHFEIDKTWLDRPSS